MELHRGELEDRELQTHEAPLISSRIMSYIPPAKSTGVIGGLLGWRHAREICTGRSGRPS